MIIVLMLLAVLLLPKDAMAQSSLLSAEHAMVYNWDGIRAEAHLTLDNDYCVFIRNNTDKPIGELKAVIRYYDADGQVMDYDQDWHNAVLPGSTVVSKLRRARGFAEARLEMEILPDANPLYRNHANNVIIASFISNYALNVEVRNVGATDIKEIEYAVVYYSADVVSRISHARDLHDVRAGQTVASRDYPPPEYDRYEIFINQAHTYK